MRIKWVVVASALVLAAPSAADTYKPLPRSLAALSPQDFSGRVTVSDDPRERAVVLSTAPGYTRGQSMRGAFADDVHLRARVDRSSGATTWQAWFTLINHHPKTAVTAVVFPSRGSLRSVVPDSIEQWDEQCPAADSAGSCFFYMRVVFTLPEDVIAEIARSYREGSREPWKLRFKSAATADMTGGLAPAEAAGLFAAVRDYKAGVAPSGNLSAS